MSDNIPQSAKLPESVNSQITDSVTSANAPLTPNEITPAAPNIYMGITNALVNAANNAVNAQQQSYTTLLAATTMGVAAIYAIDTAAAEATSQHIAQTRTELAEAMTSLRNSASADLSDADRIESQNNEFASGIRAITDAFAASLDRLSESAYSQTLHIIQLAAIASSLAALIKSPEQAQSYERVLGIIKNLR